MADLGDIGASMGQLIKIPVFAGNANSAGIFSGTVEVAGLVGRARVYLIRTGIVVGVTEAAGDGTFSFQNVAPGSYEVLVYGEGQYRSKVFGPITVT